jgi:hypothetical protein
VSDALYEHGWIAPADPGPRRRQVVVLLLLGVVLFVGWGALGTGWLAPRIDDDELTIRITIGENGTIHRDGKLLETSFRFRGDTTFIVAQARLGSGDDSNVLTSTSVPAGTDADQVAVRLLKPHGTARDAELLVTVPVAALPDPPKVTGKVEPLRAITDPFDERIRTVRDDRHLLLQVRAVWPWIALAAMFLLVVVPLLAWHRARSRFFSMRLPGPGRELDIAPPSSVDPVGAAVLVAGARPVDQGAAFAGHVLDLVERRQLPMRRSVTTPPGLGTLLGLHHADELDDVAVDVLGSVVADDGFTVVLPDSLRQLETVPVAAELMWHRHVLARIGFERVMESAGERRLRFVSAVISALAILSTIAWIVLDLDGQRAVALLVATGSVTLAATLGAWLRDQRRWHVVARSRRTERAQWLAWRDGAAASDGPISDRRNLPVLVAIGASTAAMSASASPTAVDLDAVTPRTIEALRGLLHGD